MFGPKAQVVTPERAATKPTPEPIREKRATTELECFKPSTFTSRNAEANLPAPPRIVSLGATEFTHFDNKGVMTSTPAELFMDVDQPMRRWVQIEGVQGMIPLHDDDVTKPTNKVIATYPVQGRPRGPSLQTMSSPPEAPTRPV